MNSEIKFELVNLLNDFNFCQLIKEPTRNVSILDLIITNCLGFIQNSGVDDPINDLDHCPIYGSMNLKYPKKSFYYRTISQYNETNLNELKENLSLVPWNALLSANESIDDITDTFTAILKDEIKNAIPTKTVLVRPNDKPVMTGHVRKLLRKCHRLHKIAMTSKSEIDIENHKAARREAKHAWRLAQKIYKEKMCLKMEDPNTRIKTYWKLTKASLGQNKIQNIPSLIVNGITYTDDASKAELLNEFFVSQPTQSTSIFTDNETIGNTPQFELNSIPIQKKNILKILKSLHINKACGIDGIGNNILKKCAESLTEPINILANASLTLGCFPSSWKQANVVPIFKKKTIKLALPIIDLFHSYPVYPKWLKD